MHLIVLTEGSHLEDGRRGKRLDKLDISTVAFILYVWYFMKAQSRFCHAKRVPWMPALHSTVSLCDNTQCCVSPNIPCLVTLKVCTFDSVLRCVYKNPGSLLESGPPTPMLHNTENL